MIVTVGHTLLLLFSFQDARFYTYWRQGKELIEDRQYEQAISALENAISLRPESSQTARIHGVQFIHYYPYTLLAEACLFTDKFEKAKIYLDKANEYKEFEENEIAASDRVGLAGRLDILTQVIRRFQPGTKSKPDMDTTRLWEDILQERYDNAWNTIQQMLVLKPNDPTLLRFSSVVSQLLTNKRRLANLDKELKDLRRQNNQRIADLLQKAAQMEQQSQLEEAIRYYLAVQELAPDNQEANRAISRIRLNFSQQGIETQAIEEKFEAAKTRNKELEIENQQFKSQVEELQNQYIALKKTNQVLTQETSRPENNLRVEWHIGIEQQGKSRPIIAASATIISDLPLQDATLFLNNKKLATWRIENQLQFTTPRLNALPQKDNEFLLKATDQYERTQTFSHSFSYRPPTLPLVIKHVKRILLTLVILTTSFFFAAKVRQRRKAFRNRFNPYIAGAPILHDDMFYGRKPLLRQILNTLHNNSIMICGERRIGKTSFLHQLTAALPKVNDPNYDFHPVFIDLQGVQESAFFKNIDAEIHAYMEEKGYEAGDPTPEDLNSRQFTRRLRNTINELKKHGEKAPKLVLLLDEVDVMNGFSESTNQQLRAVFMKGFAKHLVAVMAGIHISTRWKSEGSPWYNFFEQIELKPFTRSHAISLIKDPVNGVYSYDKDAIEEIISLTSGKPYLIQKMCVNLVSHLLTENRQKISKKDVLVVFDQIKNEFFGAIS